VGIGILVPFSVIFTMFVGGLVGFFWEKKHKASADIFMVPLASGLIAGEAIVGILLAVVFLAGMPAIATFKFFPAWGGWLSLIGFAAIGYVLIRIPTRVSTTD
jgi:hypothetical protein